jgi:hypothetical protein
MGWFTFQFNGNATTPQADDAETATVAETGQGFVTIPRTVQLTDIVLTASASDNHQYSIFVNGKKQTSDLFSAEISPTSQTRFNIAAQGIGVAANSQIQLRGSQKSGTAAEATSVTLVYK